MKLQNMLWIKIFLKVNGVNDFWNWKCALMYGKYLPKTLIMSTCNINYSYLFIFSMKLSMCYLFLKIVETWLCFTEYITDLFLNIFLPVHLPQSLWVCWITLGVLFARAEDTNTSCFNASLDLIVKCLTGRRAMWSTLWPLVQLCFWDL